MENKEILKILGNPEEYAGKPEWADMMFAVRRLMEKNDIYKRQQKMNNLKHLTISQYLDILYNVIGFNVKKEVIMKSLPEIRDYQDLSYFLSDWTNGEIWAYSLKELDYCLEEEKNICVVLLHSGKEVLAELPPDEYMQNIKKDKSEQNE